MWISILNYNMGQIEVTDISDFDAEIDKDCNTDTNIIAEMWLISNGYNPDEVHYMTTDECPLCVLNNLETHLNL